MWMKSFPFITLQVLISFFRSPKRSHGNSSHPAFAVLLSPRSLTLDLYVWRVVRGSSQITEGIFGEKDVIWVPQRRASAYLYLIFSPVARNLYCHKGISMSIEENNSSSFNWTSEKVETCDNMELCQESVLIIKSGKRRKGHLGWVGRKVDCFLVKAVSPSPGQH